VNVYIVYLIMSRCQCVYVQVLDKSPGCVRCERGGCPQCSHTVHAHCHTDDTADTAIGKSV
jgi:hypothetical protein